MEEDGEWRGFVNLWIPFPEERWIQARGMAGKAWELCKSPKKNVANR
jgi:hypothetical protein